MSAYFVLSIQYVGRPPETRNVTAATTSIGRDSGDIVLNDPQGSTRHAEILFQGGRVFVRDTGSTNGTWFNGQRVTEFPLEAGQMFRCGQTVIQLVSVNSGQPMGPMGTVVAMAAAPAHGYGSAPQPAQQPAWNAPPQQPAQSQGWGAQQPPAPQPQAPAWGAPPSPQQQGGYGGVPGAQQAQGYEAPQAQGYGAPQAQGYEAPQAQGYGAPQAQGYGAPQAQGYGAPQAQGYGAPQAQGYGAPQAQGYGAPQAQGYRAPQAQGYPAPQAQGYGAPQAQAQQPGYGAPQVQPPAQQVAYGSPQPSPQQIYGAPPPSFGARSRPETPGAGALPPGGLPPAEGYTAPPAGADPAGGVRTYFDAAGGKLFVTMLVGGLLSVITLGIYMPWYMCNLTRFILSSTTLGPTGHGRLKLEFTGKGGALFVVLLVGGLLSVITLGIYVPWFLCKLLRFYTDNTLITAEDGTQYRLRFVGEGGELLVPILVGILLTYITAGIYGPWFTCKIHKELLTRTTLLENEQPVGSFDFEGKGGELFVTFLVGFLLLIVTLGIYAPWFQVKLYKFYAAGTRARYQNRVFIGEFQGAGKEYFVTLLVGVLLTIITAYIYLPWFLIKVWKFQWNNRVFKEADTGGFAATQFSAGMGP